MTVTIDKVALDEGGPIDLSPSDKREFAVHIYNNDFGVKVYPDGDKGYSIALTTGDGGEIPMYLGAFGPEHIKSFSQEEFDRLHIAIRGMVGLDDGVNDSGRIMSRVAHDLALTAAYAFPRELLLEVLDRMEAKDEQYGELLVGQEEDKS